MLRRRLELRGARRAARRASAGDIAALEAVQDAMEDAARRGDTWGVVEHDLELHLGIFRLSGLLALEPILARCTMHTHRFKLWAPWHRRPLQETAARHRPLLAALAAGDGGALAAGLARHLDTIVESGKDAAA